MALSYVWLLIKPSHLALSLCKAPSLIPLSLSFTPSDTPTPPQGRAHIQVSSRALIWGSFILSSGLKLLRLKRLPLSAGAVYTPVIQSASVPFVTRFRRHADWTALAH